MSTIYNKESVKQLMSQTLQENETQANGNDPAVRLAKSALEAAQTKLAEEKLIRDRLREDARYRLWSEGQRAAARDEMWQRCHDAEVALEQAQNSYSSLLTGYWQRERSAAEQKQATERQKALDARQAQLAKEAEETAKAEFRVRYLAAGGSVDGFEPAFKKWWDEELLHRASVGYQTMGEKLRRNGRYSLI